MDIRALQLLAESWRMDATKIEAKYPPKTYTDIANVVTALEGCAADLESWIKGTQKNPEGKKT